MHAQRRATAVGECSFFLSSSVLGCTLPGPKSIAGNGGTDGASTEELQ